MKHRFIVEVESTPMDEDGELEDLSWYLREGIRDHYEDVSVTVITDMGNSEKGADRDWADNWHEQNCDGQEYCQASDSFQEVFPCGYAGVEEPEDDHGINLSSYG